MSELPLSSRRSSLLSEIFLRQDSHLRLPSFSESPIYPALAIKTHLTHEHADEWTSSERICLRRTRAFLRQRISCFSFTQDEPHSFQINWEKWAKKMEDRKCLKSPPTTSFISPCFVSEQKMLKATTYSYISIWGLFAQLASLAVKLMNDSVYTQ